MMFVPSMVGGSTLDWSMAGNILDGRWLCDGAMVVPSIVGKHSQLAVADRKDAVVGCPSAPLTLSTSSIPNRQLPIGRMQSSVRQSSCSQFQAFPISRMLIGRMLSSSVRLSPMCRQLHACVRACLCVCVFVCARACCPCVCMCGVYCVL